MMLGQERPFTARQNIGIVLARVQLTGIRCDGDTVNWRAEIVKCSCWYSPRCHDLWAGIAAKHRYCNFQGADALTKLHKCESAIKKRHLHFLKLLFRQAAQRVGRTFKKKKKKRKNLDFFFFFFPPKSLQNILLWSNQPDCLLSPPCFIAAAFPHAGLDPALFWMKHVPWLHLPLHGGRRDGQRCLYPACARAAGSRTSPPPKSAGSASSAALSSDVNL